MVGEVLMLVNESLAAYSGLISAALILMNLAFIAAFIQMRAHSVRKRAIMNKQLQMSNSGVMGVGERVLHLEKQLTLLSKQQQELNDSHVELACGRARSMLNQGLSDETVAASSGLSVAEVSLMKMMQQPSHQLDRAS
ncbi:DUF2802 domain-containing protein [Agaribacterium sp. ZY112]|uniref:DUF2802 domain-containing protein n=1 Tax=Agaribacterium sp. ZY112 TaxID=3233574 RepID=UPI0035254258